MISLMFSCDKQFHLPYSSLMQNIKELYGKWN